MLSHLLAEERQIDVSLPLPSFPNLSRFNRAQSEPEGDFTMARFDAACSALRRQARQTFLSLSSRNFRCYVTGETISYCGSGMQTVAFSWLVYAMTHDARLLALCGVMSLAPMLLVGFGGGWLADLLDRRKILMTSETAGAIQSALVAILIFTGHIAPWQLIGMSCLTGTRMAFDLPARQAFVSTLAGREALANAQSISSSLTIASRTLGYALGGVLIATAGAGTCFVIDAASFVAALTALVMIKTGSRRQESGADETASTRRDRVSNRQVVSIIWRNQQVRTTFLQTAAVFLTGTQFFILLPVFATDVLAGGSTTLGLLNAAETIGAAAGALILANRFKSESSVGQRHLNRLMLVFAALLAAFALSAWAPLSLCLMVLIGCSLNSLLTANNSMVQLAVPAELRGRTRSIMLMIMSGAEAAGNLVVGWCARLFGAPATLAVCAVLCAVAALCLLRLQSRQDGTVA